MLDEGAATEVATLAHPQCQQHEQAPTSKWLSKTYLRSSRLKRGLEEAGERNILKITTFFKTMNQEDMLKIEILVLKRKLLASMKLSNNSQESPLKNPKFSAFLQELVDSALLNAGRQDGGKRYSIKLMDLSTHFFILGGLQTYELMYKNLPIPSVSGVRRNLSSKEIIYEGHFRFKELEEFLTKRNLPKKVVVCEDATRCEGKVQYHRASNQIIGFPVPLDSNGLPIVGTFPAASAKVINQYFQENSPASNVYCIIVQPLASNSPTFCLALFGTNNKFTANDVKARWKWMVTESAKHGIEIVCNSTDGDTRCLSAMCSLVFTKQNSNDWFFSRSLSQVVQIQDSIHIGTKLKSRLLSPSMILPMGKYTANRGHLVELVRIASKDLHCLTMSYLDPKDKMNFRAVQIMTDPQVISLLRETFKDAEATATYLEMTRSILSAFRDKNLSALVRVQLIWKWVFFLRIWRQWLKDHHGYSVSHNFISLNSYYCIELNAHGLIHMIRKFRDQEEPHLFLPWLFASQGCEEFFRSARSMTSTHSTVVNFSVLEFQHRIKRIDFLNESKCKLNSDFVFTRSKRVALDDQSDNASISPHILPEDIDIDFAISAAKQEAVDLAIRLGMLSKRNAKIPPMELPKVTLQRKANSNDCEEEIIFEEIENEEEDGELVECGDESCDESSADGDDCDESNYLGECDECDVEEDLLVASTGALKITTVKNVDVTPTCPFVKVLDGNGNICIIRKSSLCWLLSSGDVKLSSDRLERVKSSNVSHNCHLIDESASRVPSIEEEITIGDWCAFKSEDNSIVIGHVHAFSYATGSTWRNQEYSSITVPTTAPSRNARGVGCLCSWYKLQRNKKLQAVNMDVHGYYDVSKYVCTVPRPKVSCNQYILRCSLVDISRAK